MSRFTALALASAALALTPAARALNPIVQTIYTADPAPMVHEGTVYLYTGHDEDGSTWFTMRDWRCFTTTDMVNWTDRGKVCSLDDFSWANKNAWAGQCVARYGKFYLYVPVERNEGGMAIGVAVSDHPTGPFQDALGTPLVYDKFGDIDPTVFIDRDGQAYLSWGNPTYKYVRLNADMISYDTSVGDHGIVRHPMTVASFGPRTKDDRATAYEEAPWIYRRGDRYYLFVAGGPVPEHLAYSTGPSPEGPWTYGGIIMPTQGGSFTNHPGVIDYAGKTYLFYHNGALPGGGGFTRSVCVDELHFNPDGSVVPLDMTTQGVAPVATLNPYQRTEAETIAWSEGIETEPGPHESLVVYPTQPDAYIRVMHVDFGPIGAAAFTAAVSVGTTATAIELHLDAPDGPLLGTLNLPSQDEAGALATTPVRAVAGIHDLFLIFAGDLTAAPCRVDYWQFTSTTAPSR